MRNPLKRQPVHVNYNHIVVDEDPSHARMYGNWEWAPWLCLHQDFEPIGELYVCQKNACQQVFSIPAPDERLRRN